MNTAVRVRQAQDRHRAGTMTDTEVGQGSEKGFLEAGNIKAKI